LGVTGCHVSNVRDLHTFQEMILVDRRDQHS
jgi:hypothetical protein